MSRAKCAWAVVLLTAAACGSVSSSPGEASPRSSNAVMNVSGTIDRGPVPTCPAGEPCDPAMVAYRLVFSAPGAPDASVIVRGNGTFALHLEPGRYSIAAEPPSFQGKLEPSVVQVPKEGTVYLQLHIVRSG